MDNLKHGKQIAYSSEETLEFSYECAKQLSSTEGDYVECGVAEGAQIIAMALGAPNKTIHAFDSFEGIPLPSNKDDQMPGIRYLSEEEQNKLPAPGKQELKTSGATAISLESFMNNVSKIPNLNRLKIYKGWFEETVSKANIDKISILRLDGDLYNSTLVCLEAFYKKVIKGGIIIIDDWELKGCQLACEDFFKKNKIKPEIKRVSNIAYFIK
jgi:O-methyltransferase